MGKFDGFRGGRPGGPGGFGGNEDFNLEQMEKETEEMLKMRFLDKKNAEFKATGGGFVSLKVGDEEYSRIQVVRMFPFTDPDHYISIRTSDENSKEIGIIKDLKDVSKETAELLVTQMNLRYFTPIITKIINIKDEYGYAYFDVMTDRGQCRFTINMGGSSVVHLSETRILISDVDENRFEIPDVMKLSTPERKKLDLFL
ncbi:MAG: DUF1854 domain-containing protein [Lachnospiraceae bacterium]|nr:DUF1854 domain-containing protein [Lachnospiraceae bacterium]MCR4992169.1 DUF1854 domain-containing protein [Lachnospiraceae bacterium]